MGIDPAPSWENLSLHTYQHYHVNKLINEERVEAKHFHTTWWFIDNLCIVNDGGVSSTVFKSVHLS